MTPSLLEECLSPKVIDIVDNHDEVCAKWRSYGLKQQVLLHLDAHHDFGWIANKSPREILRAPNFQEVEKLLGEEGWKTGSLTDQDIHLGNYLHQVFREGRVKKWYWALPDSLWNDLGMREIAWKDLLDLYHRRTGPMDFPEREGPFFKTKILGVETLVSSLSNFPKFEEPVLLNVDIDYLTTLTFNPPPEPRVYRSQTPWIWPDELVSLFQEKNVTFTHAAISRSIRGGFAPLRYKFLGDALFSLLEGNPKPEGYDILKDALVLRSKGENGDALKLLSRFRSAGAIETARRYFSSQILYEFGKHEEAREEFAATCALDPEFQMEYSNLSGIYEQSQRWNEAREEHQMIRALDPNSHEAIAGEGRFWAAQKKDSEALPYYLDAVKRAPENYKYAFEIGRVLFKLTRLEEAEFYFQKSLLRNPSQPGIYVELARVQIALKRYDDAKQNLREALKLGFHFPVTYWLLTRVYIRLNCVHKAFECFSEFLKLKFKIWRNS
jgi:tetratricopeptide (TPR) repeat protein